LNLSIFPAPFDLSICLTEWNDVDAQVNEHALHSPCTGSTASALSELKRLEARQSESLQNIVGSEADNLTAVIRKLQIWKSAICPGTEDEAFLQPADTLVISALEDLISLTSTAQDKHG